MTCDFLCCCTELTSRLPAKAAGEALAVPELLSAVLLQTFDEDITQEGFQTEI